MENGERMEFGKVWNRVKEATNLTSFTELASIVGVRQSAVSKVKKRGDFPPGWIFGIATKYGLNSDWLATGEGPVQRPKGLAQRISEEGPEGVSDYPNMAAFKMERRMAREMEFGMASDSDESEYIHIPRYEVEASAGGGAVVHNEKVVDYLSFRAEWVKNSLGVSVRDLALISVIGDSMEPTLSEGDVVLLDMTTKGVMDGSIYALQLNGGLLVKRIQRKLDGSIVVKPDNPRYDTEIISEDSADLLKIIGRVVWVGRRL